MKNLGKTDKIIRLIIASVIIGLYFIDGITGYVAIGLLILSAVFALTGYINFCPLYVPFGLNTCDEKEG